MRHLLALLAFATLAPLSPAANKPAKAPVAATDAIPDDRGRKWWLPRHEAAAKLVAERKPDILLIGDSITHWWGGEPTEGGKDTGKAVFEHYFGDRKVVNLGYASDRTQHLHWRLKNGELPAASAAPKVAVVMIGTNNRHAPNQGHSPEETAAGVKAVCDLIHKQCPDTKILLLSIFPRANQKGDDFIGFPSRVNKHLAKLDGKDGVTYLDIFDNLANADGTPKKELFYDGIHPNANGYAVWAAAMEPTLAKLLKQRPKAARPEGKCPPLRAI